MDDLISRKVAIDQAMGRANYVDTIFDKPTESEIVYMLRSIPSVPAVPLDKLCALLAKNADCPPEHSPVQDNCKENCAECWQSVLEEWMEGQNEPE